MSLESTLRAETLTEARDQYRAFGNETPPLEDLAVIAVRLDKATVSPSMTVMAACIRLDMATHPDTPDSERPALVESATTKFDDIQDRGLGRESGGNVACFYRGQLYRAYCGLYAKAVEQEDPEVEDFQNLHADLLDLAEQILPLGEAPRNATPNKRCTARHIRGLQFEIGVHLINARRNARLEEITQIPRPSLPREDQPYVDDPIKDPQAPWDIGVSTDRFLDTHRLRRVQLTTTRRLKEDDPSVTIVSSEDLRTKHASAVIKTALTEWDSSATTGERLSAAERMDAFERRFNRKIGLDEVA